MDRKQTWIVLVSLIVAVACSVIAIVISINFKAFINERMTESVINVENVEEINRTIGVMAGEVSAIASSQKFLKQENANIQDTLNESKDMFEEQSDSLAKKESQSRIEIAKQHADNKQDKIIELLDELVLQVEYLQSMLIRRGEIDAVAYAQYETAIGRIQSELSEISSQAISDGGTNYITYTYNTNYYENIDEEIGEKEDDEKEEGEDTEPVHEHTFDDYGNCTDETCSVHQEVEVFDLIDLKRASANGDYFYHIEWEGNINFEIVYAYIDSDDVEISLYADGEYQVEVPMDRIEATYTAMLPEVDTYYVKVHTLTDGDVEISIY